MKKLMIFVISVIVPLIMAAQVQLTETNCSNGIDDDGDGLIDCMDPDCMGSPDCVSLSNGPALNGVTEGSGTFFEITNSDYLNITLASSDEITVFLSSVPQMISMNISRPATAPAPYEATLTISGLLPLTVYFKYDDSYHNLDSITTDASGNYTWTQDLTEAHHIWIQPTRSTIFICDDATGCGCTTVGTWNSTTKTCTLNTDVTETIQIDSPDITLDGNNHSITGLGTGYGVYIPAGVNNVTIKNCVVRYFTVGIQLQSNSYCSLTGNAVTNNNYYGINLSSNSNYNTLTSNNANSNSIGIYLFSSSNNNLTGNVTTANSYSGFFLASGSYNTLENNTASNNTGFGIVFQSNNNITLTNNNASHNSNEGIQITEGSNHIITGNTASFNTYNGIRLNFVSLSNISNNAVDSNNIGFYLYSITGNNILGNNVSNSINYGMYLQSCQNSTIGGTGALQSNTITGSGISGIYLITSNGIKISGNSIYGNPLAIKNLDGSNNNKAAPFITSTSCAIISGTSAPYDIVEIFGSTGPEQANYFLASTQADSVGNWSIITDSTFQYLLATSTDLNNNTSVFSFLEVEACQFGLCHNSGCINTSQAMSSMGCAQHVTYYFFDCADPSHYIWFQWNSDWYSGPNFPFQVCGTHDICVTTNNFTFDPIPNAGFTVNVDCPLPTPQITVSDASVCVGDNVTLTASPVGNYNWIPPAGSGLPTFNNQPSATYTFNQAGVYTITCLTGNLCGQVSNTVTVVVRDPVLHLNHTNINCSADCNGTINSTTTNGYSPYNYQWSPNIGSGSNFTNLCAGTYTVTVTDAQLCTDVGSVTIIADHNSPEISIAGTHNICNDDCDGFINTSVINGTPTYIYNWSNSVSNDPNLNNLCNGGIYSVTVTDANGCTSSATTTIYQTNYSVQVILSDNLICTGDPVNISALTNGIAGTPTYIWSNGSTNQTIYNEHPTSNTTYTVTVFDEFGCSQTASNTVTVIQLAPTITTQNVTCNGGTNGSVTLNEANGFSSYDVFWSNGSVSIGTTLPITLSNLSAGSYTVHIFSNNCDIISSFTITQPTAITNTTSQVNLFCNGGNTGSATVSAFGGTPYNYPPPFNWHGYNFAWSNGTLTFFSNSSTISNLSAGIYTVTVTDANNCTNAASIIITQPSSIQTNIQTLQNVSCFGGNNGSATVSASGGTPGYTYLWFNGQTTATATNLSAGTYFVTVTDANNCTVVAQGTITQPGNLTVGYFIPIVPIQCHGGSTFIGTFVQGGTAPYSYLWSNGSTSSSINPNAGTYSVTVTDANGCTATASQPIVLIDPSALNLSLSQNDILCFGACNGTATLNVTGGTVPYSYSWSNSQTTSGASSLCADTYYVTVTDAHGCSLTSNVTITEPSPISLTTTFVNPTTSTSNDGSATVSVTGGTPSYTYLWNDPAGQITTTAVGLNAGAYTVTVTDLNGCTETIQVDLVSSETITVDLLVTPYSDPCTCDGIITANVTPTGIYTFSWSNGATINSISGLCGGTYSVTVTNAQGVTATGTATVNVSPTFSYNLPPNVIPYGNDYVVLTNLTIPAGVYDMPGNLIVYNGRSLTVDNNAVIRFRVDKTLLLLPNTNLFLKPGSKLTSYCDELWTGVYAYSPSLDYKIEIVARGTTIRNAYRGIFAKGYSRVYASNSYFYNNWVDIELNNTFTTNIWKHYIKLNTFQTDIPQLFPSITFPTAQYPSIHVKLITANEISVLDDNEFRNVNLYSGANALNANRGWGIYTNTKSIVNNSRFFGLEYGVYSIAPITVQNSNFNFNNRSILISGTVASGSEVKNNTISVTNYGYITDNLSTINYGVMFNNTPNFTIFENTIKEGLLGVVTNTTSSQGNVVYNNIFENLYVSCVNQGNSEVLYNCNQHQNSGTLTYGQYGTFHGGDMVVFNGHVTTDQKHWFLTNTSTYNKVINLNCGGLNNSLKFFNNTSTPYHYLFNINNDNITDIRLCDQTNDNVGGLAEQDGNNFSYYSTVAGNCPLGPPINGSKSFAKSFITADSLLSIKEYQENVLQTLTDGGNTQSYLASIAALAPNNFIKFYNRLMAASPYLSDTVLIAFMTHPINKPAHKKDVVLANSPLPYRVMPYIDLMNVNQNFKNQMWAAQNGVPNARVQLESTIKWLGNRRQVEITGMASKCISDTLGFVTDSLIDYLGNSLILPDRMIRYSLCMGKSDYYTASNELPVINSLTADMPVADQEQYNDFTDVAEILINSKITPDSLADSLILENQSFLETIANTEFHLAQGDAKSLLEKIGIVLDYIAWLPDGSVSKSMKIPYVAPETGTDFCNLLVVYPNPSDGNIKVKYDHEGFDGIAEIILTTTDGKKINSYMVTDITGEIQINCHSCKTGNYILSFYVNNELLCSKELNIKK